MARQKLSEYRAKTLLAGLTGQTYTGISLDTATTGWEAALAGLPPDGRYVVKVDQGVKRRHHNGWLLIDRQASQLVGDVHALAAKGFRYCLVEPLVVHRPETERYLAIERTRDGRRLTYAAQGGVEIESNPQQVRSGLLENDGDRTAAATALGVPPAWLDELAAAFDRYSFAFLEINPLCVDGSSINILDAAVQVDDAAALLVDAAWTPADYRRYTARRETTAEQTVAKLAERSQASLSLEVLNPDGAVFLLLSGGGASVVVADEVANLGLGPQLANYGEYSGNPTADETYLYTQQVLDLLLASKAPAKVLLIAGGVANFTDVRATFTGVIRALDEYKVKLREQKVKVYVRRGGPHEVEGLALMRNFLERAGLLGKVAGPELVLTEVVAQALREVKHG